MRLFVSIPIIHHLKEQLQSLPRKGIDARWSHPEDYHITLRYIGEATAEHLESIKQGLETIKIKGFGLEIEGLSYFMAKSEHILYANVQSKRKITTLTAEINLKMQNSGFEMPNKPFVPHVTVARINNSSKLDQYLSSNSKKVRAGWKVSRFELMESGNSAEGKPRYKMLQGYDLQ